MRNWQNAQDEQTRPNSGIPEDPARSNRGVDGVRGEDVNAVQRRADVEPNRLRRVVVGQIIFTRASRNVGDDGNSNGFFIGTREVIDVFRP